MEFLFSVPLGGLALSCGAIALGAWLPRELDEPPIELIYDPQFVSQQPTVAYGRGAHLKSALLQRPGRDLIPYDGADGDAVDAHAHRIAVVREMLDDSYEDIRLLAFWMLDRQEKDLTQKILAQLPRLQLTLSDPERYRVNKELSLLYNELVYAYLVQGDVYRHAAPRPVCMPSKRWH